MEFAVSTRDRRTVGVLLAVFILFFSMFVISDYAHESAGELPMELIVWLVGAAFGTAVGGALFVSNTRLWHVGFVAALVGSSVFMLVAYIYGLYRIPHYKVEKVLLFVVAVFPACAIYWYWCTRKARSLGINLKWRMDKSD
jgi:uncharacterized membrane protein YeaQ/YmgE (transglycosylase-associated protein family)